MFEQRPHVLVRLRQTVGNGLCRVDCRAAADRQNKVRAHVLSQRDTLVNLAQMRIRHNTAEQLITQVSRFQRIGHRVHQTVLVHTLTAVHDEHTAAAVLLNILAGALLCVLSEKYLCGRVIVKSICHNRHFLSFFWLYCNRIFPFPLSIFRGRIIIITTRIRLFL